MNIEEVFLPVRTVAGVDLLRVEAHSCREDLGDEEGEQTSDK